MLSFFSDLCPEAYFINSSNDNDSYIIVILLFWDFFIPALTDGFSLKPKWQQVSRTLLSIIADLNYAVVWMVSNRLLISKPFSPSTNPLLTITSTPITIGIKITFIFHNFFSSLARSWYYLSFCFLSVLPCG